uniref:Uncharacterized protein n=1 Tax=Arundo donax TaxID=35708 RepID=A0A0A9B0V4_ARUDO
MIIFVSLLPKLMPLIGHHYQIHNLRDERIIILLMSIVTQLQGY